jgi:copper oxidase (laccase) domain-containing protein
VAHGRSDRSVTLVGTPVVALWTDGSDGDQRPVIEGHAQPPDGVPGDTHITGLRQVHGGGVVVVSGASNADGPRSDSSDRALLEGDALVTTDDFTCGAVLVADCVPIAIGSPEGARAAVHAGWRGLVAGVVGNAASAVRAAGGSSLVAGLGPCIGPCCYEFSPDDLETVESELGLPVRATTKTGAPALDLRACALGLLESAGVEVSFAEPSCTSCSTGWYSARARSDVPRQALYVWRSPRGEQAQS